MYTKNVNESTTMKLYKEGMIEVGENKREFQGNTIPINHESINKIASDTEKEIDELETAMQEENFTLVDNDEKPSIILYGKQCTGSHSEDGKFIEDFQFCIGQTWKDREDFSIHHIHSYEGLKLWLNQNTTGGYKFYLDLFKSR